MDFSLKKEGKEGFGKATAALPAKDTNVAYSVSDLLGAELVREAATREVAIVARQIDACRAAPRRWRRSRGASHRPISDRRIKTAVNAPTTLFPDRRVRAALDVRGHAVGCPDRRRRRRRNIEARRAADASSTRHRFSLIDASFQTHAYSNVPRRRDGRRPRSVSARARRRGGLACRWSRPAAGEPEAHVPARRADGARTLRARFSPPAPRCARRVARRPGRRAPTEVKRADVFVEERARARRTKPFAIVARRSFERRMDGRCFRHRLSTRSRSRSRLLPARRARDASRRRTTTIATPAFWKPKTRSKRTPARGRLASFERLVAEAPRDALRGRPPGARAPRPALCSVRNQARSVRAGVRRHRPAPRGVHRRRAPPSRRAALFDAAIAPLAASVRARFTRRFRRGARANARDAPRDGARDPERDCSRRDACTKNTQKKTGRRGGFRCHERAGTREVRENGRGDAFSDDFVVARAAHDSVLDAFDDERAGRREARRTPGGILRDFLLGGTRAPRRRAARQVARVPVPRERQVAAAPTGARRRRRRRRRSRRRSPPPRPTMPPSRRWQTAKRHATRPPVLPMGCAATPAARRASCHFQRGTGLSRRVHVFVRQPGHGARTDRVARGVGDARRADVADDAGFAIHGVGRFDV